MSGERQALADRLERAHAALRAWDAAVILTTVDGLLKWRFTASKLRHAFDLTRDALGDGATIPEEARNV